jgi:fluoride ion exporter CrcB/FEX
MSEEEKKSFEEQNLEAGNSGFIKEFVDLLKHNKKWWITPIIVCLLIFGVLIILGGSSAAPFIYTLF